MLSTKRGMFELVVAVEEESSRHSAPTATSGGTGPVSMAVPSSLSSAPAPSAVNAAIVAEVVQEGVKDGALGGSQFHDGDFQHMPSLVHLARVAGIGAQAEHAGSGKIHFMLADSEDLCCCRTRDRLDDDCFEELVGSSGQQLDKICCTGCSFSR